MGSSNGKDQEAADMQVYLECGERVFMVIFERNNGFCMPCKKELLLRERQAAMQRAATKADSSNTNC